MCVFLLPVLPKLVKLYITSHTDLIYMSVNEILTTLGLIQTTHVHRYLFIYFLIFSSVSNSQVVQTCHQGSSSDITPDSVTSPLTGSLIPLLTLLSLLSFCLVISKQCWSSAFWNPFFSHFCEWNSPANICHNFIDGVNYANDGNSRIHTSSWTDGIHQAETRCFTSLSTLVFTTKNTQASKKEKKQKRFGIRLWKYSWMDPV